MTFLSFQGIVVPSYLFIFIVCFRACGYVCHMCAGTQKVSVRLLAAEVSGDCGCCELNSGPLHSSTSS